MYSSSSISRLEIHRVLSPSEAKYCTQRKKHVSGKEAKNKKGNLLANGGE
jgi:hypothetical protein